MKGNVAGSDPQAMMARSNVIVLFPSAVLTRTDVGDANVPVPVKTVTLRCFASPARPPVSFLMMPSFQPRSLSMSIDGAVKAIP